MYNIAICLSGEPRYLRHNSYSIKPSIDKFKKDCIDNNINLHIFYHFWDHITKRQRNYKTESPVIEKFSKKDIEDLIPSTVSVVENKDCLIDEVKYIWEYISGLNERKPRYDNIDILQNQIMYTNSPGYSQLFSICKGESLRLQYESSHDVSYDLVIHTRTDVLFNCYNFEELKRLMEKKTFDRSVHFPHMIVRNTNEAKDIEIIPDFGFSMGSSKSFCGDVFNNYRQKLTKDIFYILEDKPTLSIRNDHTVFTNLLLNNVRVKLSPKLKCIKYTFHQMGNIYEKETKTKYSHY